MCPLNSHWKKHQKNIIKGGWLWVFEKRCDTRVFHDKQIWQKIWQKICQTNKFWKNKCAKKVASSGYWTPNSNHHSFKVGHLTNVAIQACIEWEIFQMNYSHTFLIPEITQVQKVKWCMKENSFNTSHSTRDLMATLVRHQTSKQWWLLLRDQIPLDASF